MNEKEFAVLPIRKIFFKASIPNVLSMVFSSVYIIADGIFVGSYIGGDALAAINLLMPLLMIVFALSDMIAIGSSVNVSIFLGEGNIKKARRIFSSSVLIIMLIGGIFSLAGFVFGKQLIFKFIKDSSLAQCAYSYSEVFFLFLPFIMPLFAMDNFLRVCGRARYSMWVNIIVSMLNIALDWLFIAKMKLGIEFSAYASVVSMLLGAVFSFAPFFTKKITLHFSKPIIYLKEFAAIVYNGSSEFLSRIAGSVMAAIANTLLLSLAGATAVASYGIVMYIDTLMIGILYGILDSIQPTVSYNLGAKRKDRALGFFNLSCMVSSAFSIFCMLAILFFRRELAYLFAKNDVEIIKMTSAALLLFIPSYLFTWFNMVTGTFLTAMDKPKESLIIMGANICIFPLLSFSLLVPILGVYGVFLTSFFSSFMTFILALIIWIKTKRNMLAQ